MTRECFQSLSRTPLSKQYLSSTPYPRAYIINQADQIQQICTKSDSRDVKHAEKIYTAGVHKNLFFGNLQGRFIGFREPKLLVPVFVQLVPGFIFSPLGASIFRVTSLVQMKTKWMSSNSIDSLL